MANSNNENKGTAQEDVWSGAEQVKETKNDRSLDYTKKMTEQREEKSHEVSEGRQDAGHDRRNERANNDSYGSGGDDAAKDGSWYYRSRESAGDNRDAVKRRRTGYEGNDDNEYYNRQRRDEDRQRNGDYHGYRRKDERNGGRYSRENDGYRSYRDSRDYGYGRSDGDYRRDRGSYREQRRPPVRVDPTEPNQTIGIFGLSFRTTEDELREHVRERLGAEFDNKYSLRLITNRATGRSKGFGFLTFDDIEDAIKAKGVLEGGSLDGFTYRVAYSFQRTDSSANQQSTNDFGGGDSGNNVSQTASKEEGKQLAGKSTECTNDYGVAEENAGKEENVLAKTGQKEGEERATTGEEKNAEELEPEKAQSEVAAETSKKKGGPGRKKKAEKTDSQ